MNIQEMISTLVLNGSEPVISPYLDESGHIWFHIVCKGSNNSWDERELSEALCAALDATSS